MSVVPIDAGEAQTHAKYDRLIAAAKLVPSAATVVVHPCDEASLRGVAKPPLPGSSSQSWSARQARSRTTAAKFGLDIARFEIVDAAHSEAAAARRSS